MSHFCFFTDGNSQTLRCMQHRTHRTYESLLHMNKYHTIYPRFRIQVVSNIYPHEIHRKRSCEEAYKCKFKPKCSRFLFSPLSKQELKTSWKSILNLNWLDIDYQRTAESRFIHATKTGHILETFPRKTILLIRISKSLQIVIIKFIYICSFFYDSWILEYMDRCPALTQGELRS